MRRYYGAAEEALEVHVVGDPAGKLFQAVKGRMDEDLAQLGLKITDLPPPDASRWPGLKAVVDGMKGLTPTWK